MQAMSRPWTNMNGGNDLFVSVFKLEMRTSKTFEAAGHLELLVHPASVTQYLHWATHCSHRWGWAVNSVREDLVLRELVPQWVGTGNKYTSSFLELIGAVKGPQGSHALQCLWEMLPSIGDCRAASEEVTSELRSEGQEQAS